MVALLFSVAVFGLIFFTPVYAGYGAKICEEAEYYCYKVKRGDSWQKLFPDPVERDTVMRINRMNTRLHSGQQIAIPHQVKDAMSFAPFSAYIDPPGEQVIVVSKSLLAFGAYSAEGVLQHWGPISTGKGYCPDIRRSCNTPQGKYTIYHKGGGGCASTKFPVGKGGAPMPYCMFFKGGFALHGSYNVPGYNDSHGCVRLFVNDAKWLNQDFTSGTKTRVLIRQ